MTSLLLPPSMPSCLSVTGVTGDIVYRVRNTGAWELFPRGKPGHPALDGGTEESFAAAWHEARARADARHRRYIKDPE